MVLLEHLVEGTGRRIHLLQAKGEVIREANQVEFLALVRVLFLDGGGRRLLQLRVIRIHQILGRLTAPADVVLFSSSGIIRAALLAAHHATIRCINHNSDSAKA